MDQGLILICLVGVIVTGIVGTVSIFCGGYVRLVKDGRRTEWESGRHETEESKALPRGGRGKSPRGRRAEKE